MSEYYEENYFFTIKKSKNRCLSAHHKFNHDTSRIDSFEYEYDTFMNNLEAIRIALELDEPNEDILRYIFLWKNELPKMIEDNLLALIRLAHFYKRTNPWKYKELFNLLVRIANILEISESKFDLPDFL